MAKATDKRKHFTESLTSFKGGVQGHYCREEIGREADTEWTRWDMDGPIHPVSGAAFTFQSCQVPPTFREPASEEASYNIPGPLYL